MPDGNGAAFSARDPPQISDWQHRESRSAAGYRGDLRNWSCNKRAACGANYPVGFALVKRCFTRSISILTVDCTQSVALRRRTLICQRIGHKADERNWDFTVPAQLNLEQDVSPKWTKNFLRMQ